MSDSLYEYNPFLTDWDQKASVRSFPRRMIFGYNNEEHFFYPPNRQPLCHHEKVKALGSEAIQYIITQSAYRFMHDIAVVEVDIVNQIATKIFNGSIDFGFPEQMRNNVLAVIIDEAYHAYVAIDFMKQVEKATAIKPIRESRDNQFRQAIANFKQRLPEDLHDALDVIAICTGENTLTKELFDMQKEANVHPLFKQVITDHVSDEGRHQVLFRDLLDYFWSHLEEDKKETLAPIIPDFFKEYLRPEMHIAFDKEVLKNVGLDDKSIEEIIKDTYAERSKGSIKTRLDPITNNLMQAFTRAGVFDHPKAQEKLIEMEWI